MMRKLGEIQELIENLKEKSCFKELEEAISEVMTENEKLTKRIITLKKEQEHATIRMSKA